jgi:hypothetical protein
VQTASISLSLVYRLAWIAPPASTGLRVWRLQHSKRHTALPVPSVGTNLIQLLCLASCAQQQRIHRPLAQTTVCLAMQADISKTSAV